MAGGEWGGPSPWRSKVQFVHLTNKYLEEQYRTLYMVLYLKLGVGGALVRLRMRWGESV